MVVNAQELWGSLSTNLLQLLSEHALFVLVVTCDIIMLAIDITGLASSLITRTSMKPNGEQRNVPQVALQYQK